ncbi:MAG: hypothetical protein IAG10_00590, partial [Planctomycetaceae bacterium]|nr:hypothetical protein [Planctomycetaceae bacterium]
DSLQKMHNQAIEARTKLQLDRATEQQAQDLENFKLECQLARAGKRRSEQTNEVQHDLELSRQRGEADLVQLERTKAFAREQMAAEARVRDEIERQAHTRSQTHLNVLKEMGVDLTAYLTQNRADRVIELRGANTAHVHVDPALGPSRKPGHD